MHDDRLELLTAIASKTLGIERFEPTGDHAADFRLVSAEDVGRALEAAYDAGLLVGYNTIRRECANRL